MLRRILRAYNLAPTQVAPNGWSQMVGDMYLWFRHSFGMEMPLHVFQTIYQPRKLPRKKGREEEVGWYYFCPWGSHKPLVTSCPSSIKQWKESWFWVSGNWQRVFDDPEPDLDVPSVYGIANSLPRCELSRYIVDVLPSIYQADQKIRSYGLILNRHRYSFPRCKLSRDIVDVLPLAGEQGSVEVIVDFEQTPLSGRAWFDGF
ncbi:Plus3 domain-containing protein [Abeliophyllum distichum]|uniref:Plus3 domain-containing protein n=1 Tax=Abeliophyllum distichum TaxID=126358 RepID=A0ABD1UN74_9LAMI